MSAPSPSIQRGHPSPEAALYRLDPAALVDHIELLNLVARSLCRSRDDADDLVQETLKRVLVRPRLLRSSSERGYLLRTLRNTHVDGHRAALRRPPTVPLPDDTPISGSPPVFNATELMTAIAAAPQPYREAVLAVDVVGLSYEQAARRLRTCEATVASRLFRGRQHVARALTGRGARHVGGA